MSYKDPNTGTRRISALVSKIESEHKATLGHLADFWLLLSVGEALAHPTQTYGHNAGNYRHKALRCDDISSTAFLTYGKLVDELLSTRSHPSDIRANVARIWAKRRYDELANGLVHTP